VKQIRMHKPRTARERPWHEVLPADPRDPDVVPAKARARARTPVSSSNATFYAGKRPDSHPAKEA